MGEESGNTNEREAIMILALAHERPDGGERFERATPQMLIGRLLTVMESSTYRAPDAIVVEILAECDRWELFDDNDEAAKILIAGQVAEGQR